jgi:hypothetical protein
MHNFNFHVWSAWSVSDPDNGVRASLQNIGIWLNIDVADRPRKFYNIHALWKF